MSLRVNSDFSQRVVIRPEDYQWVASPMPGVERMMLDRIGDEVARATSLVRYAPNSRFSAHVHGGGEEILVLQGTFADEHGDYPTGTYMRNPIGTAHAPSIGAEETIILVKLHQFVAEDQQQKAIDTLNETWQTGPREGIQTMPLHSFGDEQCQIDQWQSGTELTWTTPVGGAEIFVIEGTIYAENEVYPAGTWLRIPQLSQEQLSTRSESAKLFVKTGHLPQD